MKLRALASLFVLPMLLAACEGGKPRAEQCAADVPAPYNSCEQGAQCAAGEQWVEGRCWSPQGPTGCGPGFRESEGGKCELASDCQLGQHEENGECVDDQLSIELVNQSACYVDRIGEVQLIVQYTVVDQDGRNPATISDDPANHGLETSVFVDGAPLDLEAQIERDSELLQSDLVVSLVLDASHSMILHEPKAFDPMKMAAIETLKETERMWESTNSQFHWELLWFDTMLYTPEENMAGERWSIDDIARIPDPQSGTYTALYKSINRMVETHAELRANGVAAGPRDQHVMLIFSDGADNQSRDNADLPVEQHNINNQLFWTERGGAETNIDEVKENVASAENLRTYVIGFGTFFDDSHQQRLEEIAASGRGKFFYGRETSSLDDLFRDVQTEFVTLQTLGVKAPLSGEYTFNLLVKDTYTGAEGQRDIVINAGPALGECGEAEQIE